MDKETKGVSLDEFIFRKLQPIRVLRGYLRNELELADGEQITLNVQDLDNVMVTVEIFLEEYDRVSSFRGRKNGHSSKRTKSAYVDSGKSAIKAIA